MALFRGGRAAVEMLGGGRYKRGMRSHQPGIIAPLPAASRYLTFRLAHGVSRDALREVIGRFILDERCVVGLGRDLFEASALPPGLLSLPHYEGGLEPVPSTPAALWIWLRGADRGSLYLEGEVLTAQLAGLCALDDALDGFVHRGGRDLSGYEDGTENPEGEAAHAAAFVSGDGVDAHGSYVAVQRWVHDVAALGRLDRATQDDIVGRRQADNVEFTEAPASAHVKRTAQESFSPEAFLLRRSMPYVNDHEAGLNFVAFGHSLRAFDVQMRRMVGLDDGIVDGLFRFTRPVTSRYFYCPPIENGRLAL